MARRRRAPKYSGALAQPIYLEPDETVDQTIEQLAEKMALLLKHYKIPSDNNPWWRLAFRLAREHVPGLQFSFRPKVGRHRTWKAGLGFDLVRAVQDVKSQTGMGTQDALVKLQEDKRGMWWSYTIKNLGTRYREAKRHQEQFREAVEAEQALPGLVLDRLDSLVDSLLADEN